MNMRLKTSFFVYVRVCLSGFALPDGSGHRAYCECRQYAVYIYTHTMVAY